MVTENIYSVTRQDISILDRPDGMKNMTQRKNNKIEALIKILNARFLSDLFAFALKMAHISGQTFEIFKTSKVFKMST
jgi:hypothetical protein